MSDIKIKKDKELDCSIAEFTNANFKLESGSVLENIKIAFKTFGKLNKKKNNAILICHALTGDQFCTGKNPVTKKNGWWNILVGPGKVIDTNIFFVV